MGLFGGKDWNIVVVMFERPDLFRVNAQRAKGSTAVTVRDTAKKHDRTIFCAVFDQKGAFLEGEQGPGTRSIDTATLQRLIRELPSNPGVREILSTLEKGTKDKVSKALEWNGYPVKSEPGRS
jgi:hypothetical protein